MNQNRKSRPPWLIRLKARELIKRIDRELRWRNAAALKNMEQPAPLTITQQPGKTFTWSFWRGVVNYFAGPEL